MVFYLISEIALETSWWILKKTYNTGYYLLYGTPESKEDKILKQIEYIKNQNEIEHNKQQQINNACIYNLFLTKPIYDEIYYNANPVTYYDNEDNIYNDNIQNNNKMIEYNN